MDESRKYIISKYPSTENVFCENNCFLRRVL